MSSVSIMGFSGMLDFVVLSAHCIVAERYGMAAICFRVYVERVSMCISSCGVMGGALAGGPL